MYLVIIHLPSLIVVKRKEDGGFSGPQFEHTVHSPRGHQSRPPQGQWAPPPPPPVPSLPRRQNHPAHAHLHGPHTPSIRVASSPTSHRGDSDRSTIPLRPPARRDRTPSVPRAEGKRIWCASMQARRPPSPGTARDSDRRLAPTEQTHHDSGSLPLPRGRFAPRRRGGPLCNDVINVHGQPTWCPPCLIESPCPPTLHRPWYTLSRHRNPDSVSHRRKQRQIRRFDRWQAQHQGGRGSTRPPPFDPWGYPIPPGLPYQDVSVLPMSIASLTPSIYTTAVIAGLNHIVIDLDYARPPSRFPVGTAPDEILERLATADVIEQFHPADSDYLGITTIAATAEKLGTPKARFRVVSDTLTANISNAHSPTKAQFIPMSHLLVRLARLSQTRPLWYMTFDLKTSFFQVTLPTGCRNAFTTTDSVGRFFRFKRLPMGYRGSVDILQAIMQSLLADILGESLELASGLVDIYVDNALLAHHDKRLLETLRLRLNARCVELGITVGEWILSQSVVHRGVRIDTTSTSLKDTLVTKIRAHIEYVRTHSKITLKQWECLCGEITYAESILVPFPIRELYHTYRVWTDAVQRHSRFLTPPPAACAELTKASHWLTLAQPLNRWFCAYDPTQSLVESSTRHVYFTDASKHLFGYVHHHQQTIQSGQCPNPINIEHGSSASELLAAVSLINSLTPNPSLPVDNHYTFAGDNTGAQFALARRFSSAISLYTILRQLRVSCMHATFLYSATIPSGYGTQDPERRFLTIFENYPP
ncbi:Hypothetical protein, putative [Bodo saltans]|uniref:Reverse transcriptase domain-containing protein n=1 Tax=Bodo saltans TaxID=75058 RepID=A0A0S4J719_BODSA|nr:Hypothetical protein, putative [Bodo saltans]|eukprot:CUG85526.1 Hypothetical protein, putative [Bodo saltans]